MDPQAVASFIGWHRVVIQRATSLLPAAPAATHVSAFFHKKAPDLPPCCLLDQVVSHTLSGISAASRRSLAALKAPLVVADAASAADAADAFMGAGAYEVLRAVTATGEIVDAVQRHFQSAVQPKLLVVRAPDAPCPAHPCPWARGRKQHDVAACSRMWSYRCRILGMEINNMMMLSAAGCGCSGAGSYYRCTPCERRLCATAVCRQHACSDTGEVGGGSTAKSACRLQWVLPPARDSVCGARARVMITSWRTASHYIAVAADVSCP